MVKVKSRITVNYIGKQLYSFYKAKKYCDLWLQSSDGVDFMAHRCVCAASSLVIGSVISSVGEVSPSASILIPLKSIDSETLKYVIDFTYLGDITIREPLVTKLFHAAQVLEMSNLEEACQEALDQLSTEASGRLTNLTQLYLPDDNEVDVKTEYVSTEEEAQLVLSGEIEGQQFEIHESEVQHFEGEEIIGTSSFTDSIELEDGTSATIMVEEGGDITEPNAATLESIESQLLGKSFEERKHVKGPFYCNECGFKFNTTGALAKHRLLHFTKSTRLQCTFCGKILFSKKALEEHEAKHGNDPPNYHCSLCNKSFAVKGALTRHEQMHSNERAYQCQFCNKTFHDELACEQHMDTHSGIKQYGCSYCEFACNSKLILYKHEAKHRGVDISTAKGANNVGAEEKSFTCHDCNKTFSHYSSYWMHLRVHADDRRFPCRYCGKSFFTKQQTSVHERIHTGSKPYGCSICGKTFSQPGRVKLHERIHTGEKPYACRHCGKTFAVKGNCDAHERIHTGEKRYECPFCGERFALKSRMIQHQMVHGSPQILEMKEVEVDGSAVTEISIAMN